MHVYTFLNVKNFHIAQLTTTQQSVSFCSFMFEKKKKNVLMFINVVYFFLISYMLA